MATIAGIASSSSEFNILVAALGYIDANVPESNLIGTLNDETQSLTVFAPTDAAFGALAADLGFSGDTGDEDAVATFLVTNVPATTLQQVVLYHVAGGELDAAAVAASNEVTTLQGGTIGTADLPTLVDNEPDLIDPSLVATDINADNGIIHVIDKVLLPIDLPGNDAPSLTEIVAASGGTFDSDAADFDILLNAVLTAGLAGTLDSPTLDATVFAPTDQAFVDLATALGYTGTDEAGAWPYLVESLTLLGQGDPIPLLTTILTYHVSGESLQASQVLSQASISTLAGVDIAVDPVNGKLIDAATVLPDPTIIGTDIQASNGVAHVIDKVLVPADLFTDPETDFLIDFDGDSTVFGVNGDDFAKLRDGDDVYYGGRGNDTGLGDSGNDTLYGGQGEDVYLGGSGNDGLFGGRDDDTLNGGEGNDFLIGGGGADVMDGGADDDRMIGGEGGDVMDGGQGNDDMSGGSGADNMFGAGGNDDMAGGADGDTLAGGEGNDFVNGGDGDDTLFGGDNDDTLIGASGNDTIQGDAGNDKILGASGNDDLYGGEGNDFILAQDGDNTISGGSGDDRLIGAAGNDILYGGGDDDDFNGGIGNDTLFGGDGNDEMAGANGDDIFDGGAGNDNYYGGQGADTYVAGEGQDFVSLFEDGTEKIDVSQTGVETFDALMMLASSDKNITTFDFGDGNTLTVRGMREEDIDESDFLF